MIYRTLIGTLRVSLCAVYHATMNLSATVRGVIESASAMLDRAWPTVVSTELSQFSDWRPDASEDYCQRCGASAGPGSVLSDGCTFCRGKTLSWDRLTRLSMYSEPMDGWLKQMKFARQWSWATHLGRQLGGQLGDAIDPQRVVVTYVPMHWRRRWRRGFNQAHLMASAMARSRGWPMVPLIRRTVWTPPQPSVIASQREANVRQSFALRDVDLKGWQVIVVDDIKTSGATLGTCCKLIRGAGARSIHVAVAAVADPKGMNFKLKA